MAVGDGETNADFLGLATCLAWTMLSMMLSQTKQHRAGYPEAYRRETVGYVTCLRLRVICQKRGV